MPSRGCRVPRHGVAPWAAGRDIRTRSTPLNRSLRGRTSTPRRLHRGCPSVGLPVAPHASFTSRPQAMLAYNPENMTEDEREHLLSTVGQAHAGLPEVALKLRLGLPPKTPVLKTAIKAERAAFDLKRSLQRLEVKDVETITRRAPVLPEVRRGGKVVDPESLLRHENRHDERLTGLPRRNNPRRSV